MTDYKRDYRLLLKENDLLLERNARLRLVVERVLHKLDRDGAKPGWGVVRDWLREALYADNKSRHE